MAWATTDDVEDVTGSTVTSGELSRAQAVVELFVGRTPAADDQPTRAVDLHWLKQAVCWQAVWLKDQPGYNSRSSFSDMAQDGFQLSVGARHDLHLAPLAARAIKNLTWMSSRSIEISRLAEDAVPAFNLESSDNYHYWRPL